MFRARAYSDWSPLTTPDHTAFALCAFPQLGNSPLRFRRRTSFVPLVPPVRFVSTFAQTHSVCRSDLSVLYSPRASSQHRSLPSFLSCAQVHFSRRTISDFFDEALLCRCRVDFQPAPELPMHRPTIVGPAGTEGNHSSAFCGRPSFFTAAVAAARCLVPFSRSYGAEMVSLDPVHMLNHCRQFFCTRKLFSTSCGHRHVTLAFRSRTLSQ